MVLIVSSVIRSSFLKEYEVSGISSEVFKLWDRRFFLHSHRVRNELFIQQCESPVCKFDEGGVQWSPAHVLVPRLLKFKQTAFHVFPELHFCVFCLCDDLDLYSLSKLFKQS